jgi:hypothetical protein
MGVRDYCDAFDKGVGRDETIATLVEQTGETPELLTSMKPVGFVPNGTVDATRLEADMQVLAERGLMPAGVQVDTVFDHSFTAEAGAQIGEYK